MLEGGIFRISIILVSWFLLLGPSGTSLVRVIMGGQGPGLGVRAVRGLRAGISRVWALYFGGQFHDNLFIYMSAPQ